MKKIILTLTLGFTSTFMMAQTSIVIEDFDNNRNLNTWTGAAGNYMNSTSEAPASVSDSAGKYELTTAVLTAGDNWIGTRVNSIMGNSGAWGGYDVDNYPFYSIDVYSDQTMNLGLKIEEGCCGDPKANLAEEYQDYTTANSWQTLYFDLSDADGLGTDMELVFLIDIFNTSTEKVFYFDNFTAYQNDPLAAEEANTTINSVYPNPATNKVSVAYSLESASDVTITISDVLGNAVSTDNVGQLGSGTHTSSYDVSSYASGLYICSIVSNGAVITKSFVVE